MISTSCAHHVGPVAAQPAVLQRLKRHGNVHSSTFAAARHVPAARLGDLHSMRMHGTGQDAQPDVLSSGRRSIAAAASPRSAAQPGTAADMQQEQEATKSSQETARVAQALVSKASNQQREGDAKANRQGLALLVAAAGVWAAAHRDAMLAALRHISTPDVAAGLLVAAALLRLMPARARAGAAHFTALLQSVFLLGSIAYDIAEVKQDIKQVQAAMQGLYARAAWVPPKLTADERQQQRQQQRQQRKREAQWGSVGAA